MCFVLIFAELKLDDCRMIKTPTEDYGNWLDIREYRQVTEQPGPAGLPEHYRNYKLHLVC